MEFYFQMFSRCARFTSDESIHVCKYERDAYLKAKHTNIQKSYVFAGQMQIFSENGSTIYTNLRLLTFAESDLAL